MSTGIPNQTPDQQANLARRKSSTTSTTTAGLTASAVVASNDLGIESSDFIVAPGVDLSDKQRVLVGSVLDLFAGKPTLKKLSLWTDDATFNDPLTKSAGRRQYSAQWYGLAAAFSEITRPQPVQITSTGNPITLTAQSKYKLKGLGTEKTIDSVIKIFTDEAGERIVSVEDRWNGNIPDGVFARTFRGLNAVTVPLFVGVPKSEEQEAEAKK